jgi:putative hydrolase
MKTRIDRSLLIPASKLLDSKEVPHYDFHIHTTYSDGKASVKEVFEKAIDKKLDTIIFTEHTENWHHSNDDWYTSYYNEIVKYRELYSENIMAYIGLEAPATTFSGDLELPANALNSVEFLIGAAHRYPDLNQRKTRELNPVEAIDLEYRTLYGLANNQQLDAIAHIGATCAKYCTPFPKSLARQIVRVATDNGIAIEINPVYHEPLLEFIELCAEEDALVTLGSNAHGFNDIGMVVEKIKIALSL